jgi:V/A-type H+-transporting ATPase subunit D
MAARKIKLTKNELLAQQRQLRKYQRFLPTLQLKKQQLQQQVRKAVDEVRTKELELREEITDLSDWIALFALVSREDWQRLIRVENTKVGDGNIAGVKVPLFEDVEFHQESYSLFGTDPWLDPAIEAIKGLLRLQEEIRVLHDKTDALRRELSRTTQRVNLFEKVLIPQCEKNTRVIAIFLGDEERNAVGRAKIAKRKLAAQAAS